MSDSSTYHTFLFDPKTGEPVRGCTYQGYQDSSAWARGQTWGIYGVALGYRYTKDEKYMELLTRLSKDWELYW